MKKTPREACREMLRALEVAEREIERQNAQFREALSDAGVDPAEFAAALSFRAHTQPRPVLTRSMGTRG